MTADIETNSNTTNSHTLETQDVKLVDVAIVGGAMTGATLALSLKKLSEELNRPLKIALIEAHKPGSEHPGFDARSIAIAHGSIFELKRLGLWSKLAHLGTPIENIHISDRGHFGMTELNAEDFHLQSLGQVVELERVGQVLFKQLEASDVQLHCPETLAHVEAQVDCQLLTLNDGTQIKTALLVAADGVNSKVRQTFNLPLEQVDFEQVALVANVETDKPHDNWAFERFTNTGPLAVLPMAPLKGNPRVSLVWALTPSEAERLQSAAKDEFLAELQQAFGFRAGRFTQVGERFSYPLLMSHMPRPIYHRTVFIGNAAQTLHPIAGQGFNLGLRDLVSLLDVVKQRLLAEGETVDLGSAKLTHTYLKSREKDRFSTMTNVECLVRGFSNDHWPLVVGRSLGLRLLSWLPPLKVPVARAAMGWKSVS
ncbi:2-octaprenyl-6-methoxyphenol hydroxylase, FAD/NAD(P)-binding [Shewanella benthica]|uniref:2-octaprenyl-6-methoxyphenol hydroxylase, FAD/NAD(P)-binding n=2 Tax=Shewanella benthica TaxID=43661 RepID=A0A330M1K8_9GAMM|nr:2-octaprenyl-6-methoxyphenyl hydroxylase [Shewanella benthica]SQH75323.1 2-octaprenyl-6-methoxyphenol hydroxylase, FAD/NAD(P)-binding [Shewanella benthica]